MKEGETMADVATDGAKPRALASKIKFRRIRLAQWWSASRENLALAIVSRVLRWAVPTNNLIAHAEREMGSRPPVVSESSALGNPDRWMYDHVMLMIRLFCLEGHSGMSASFARHRIDRLLAYKPLGPLTGEPDEWMTGHLISDGERAQNRRRSSIFRDADGVAYDSEGFVFREPPCDDRDGYRPTFTGYESRRIVRFPYAVPDSPLIVDVPDDSTTEQRIEAIRAAGVPDEDIYVFQASRSA